MKKVLSLLAFLNVNRWNWVWMTLMVASKKFLVLFLCKKFLKKGARELFLGFFM